MSQPSNSQSPFPRHLSSLLSASSRKTLQRQRDGEDTDEDAFASRSPSVRDFASLLGGDGQRRTGLTIREATEMPKQPEPVIATHPSEPAIAASLYSESRTLKSGSRAPTGQSVAANLQRKHRRRNNVAAFEAYAMVQQMEEEREAAAEPDPEPIVLSTAAEERIRAVGSLSQSMERTPSPSHLRACGAVERLAQLGSLQYALDHHQQMKAVRKSHEEARHKALEREAQTRATIVSEENVSRKKVKDALAASRAKIDDARRRAEEEARRVAEQEIEDEMRRMEQEAEEKVRRELEEALEKQKAAVAQIQTVSSVSQEVTTSGLFGVAARRWSATQPTSTPEYVRAVGRACMQLSFSVPSVLESARSIVAVLDAASPGDVRSVYALVANKLLTESDNFNLWYSKVSTLLTVFSMTQDTGHAVELFDIVMGLLSTRCACLLLDGADIETNKLPSLDSVECTARYLGTLLVMGTTTAATWCASSTLSPDAALTDVLLRHVVRSGASPAVPPATSRLYLMFILALLETTTAELMARDSNNNSMSRVVTETIEMARTTMCASNPNDPSVRRLEIYAEMLPQYKAVGVGSTPTPPVYNLRLLQDAFLQ
eukprot:PhM_4_TR15717/c0_g2_i1/m.28635